MSGEERQRPGGGTIALRLVVAIVLAYLAAPVVIILILSFNASNLMGFPPEAFSVRWYARFLGDGQWQSALWTSLKVAALTMLFATSLGLLAALALVRGQVRWRQAALALILSPMIVPTIITAVAFYLAFAPWGASGSILAMALGHTVLALPLVVVLLAATLKGLDPAYERAALSLGASRLYVLRRITVPLVAPGVVSAALFAFLSSFDELLVPLFLSGVRAQTLTVRIWNSLLLQVEPTIAAVSAFLIGVTVLVLVTDAALRGRGGRAGGGA